MKTYLSVATLAVLTLAFGLAYADVFPVISDVGTELNRSALPGHDSAAKAKDFGAIGKRESELFPGTEAIVEVGAGLYNELLIKDSMSADSAIRGAAAGGVAREDVNTMIWNDLLRPTGGTDLP